MHCIYCGSEFRIGGPRCCNGQQRAFAAAVAEQTEKERAEARLLALEAGLEKIEKAVEKILNELRNKS
jgi:hypothetical protein